MSLKMHRLEHTASKGLLYAKTQNPPTFTDHVTCTDQWIGKSRDTLRHLLRENSASYRIHNKDLMVALNARRGRRPQRVWTWSLRGWGEVSSSLSQGQGLH